MNSKSEINPSLDAVAEAFKRRQLLGTFVTNNQNISLDALLYSDRVGLEDSDLAAPDVKKFYDRNRGPQTTKRRRGGRGIC